MAEYRTVKMSFWTDPYVENLTAEGKLLYLYLFTCPHANNLGVMETTLRRIAYETGLDAKIIKELLAKMERSGKVVIDNDCILLTHFIRHQCSTSPKIIASLQALFGMVISIPVRQALCKHYPHLFKDIDTLSIPYQYPIDTDCIPSAEVKKEVKIKDFNITSKSGDLDEACDQGNPQQAELVPQPQAMPCPQQKILAIYHEVLPELPRVVKLDDDLQKNVRSRWQDKRKEKGFATEEEGLAYFKAFFEYVSHNSWLMGRADGQKGWRSDYRWLMAPKNFKKVTNGQYRGWDE